MVPKCTPKWGFAHARLASPHPAIIHPNPFKPFIHPILMCSLRSLYLDGPIQGHYNPNDEPENRHLASLVCAKPADADCVLVRPGAYPTGMAHRDISVEHKSSARASGARGCAGHRTRGLLTASFTPGHRTHPCSHQAHSLPVRARLLSCIQCRSHRARYRPFLTYSGARKTRHLPTLRYTAALLDPPVKTPTGCSHRLCAHDANVQLYGNPLFKTPAYSLRTGIPPSPASPMGGEVSTTL